MAIFELTFKPGVTTRVDVPERNLLFYAAQRTIAAIPDQAAVVSAALANPIGAGRLDSLLKREQSVVILFDDATRPTPAGRILPPILATIRAAGIPDSHVTLFAAMGTHRPMTEDELRLKLGDDIRQRYRVINRDYRSAHFVSLGKTTSGTPVFVDRAVVEADVKIAVGNVVPHISAGWGGGSKMLLPGCCSQITTDMMHLMACIVQPVLEVIGTRDNKPREEMDAIAGKVGLSFIVNTVMDEEKNMLGVFAGHYVAAHRAATRLAEKVMVVPIPRQADIVIVSAHPCHFDYWQGIKPYAYCHRAVREGGIIIFMLDGEEHLCGDAPSHEQTVRTYLPWSFADQRAAVERGEVQDLVGLNVPMYHATVRHHVRKTICVTNHLTLEELALLGFDSAPSVQAALADAFGLLGKEATVGIIPSGGETLVRIAPEEC
jgi:lactate racemase